jgi:hypothetical protein
MDHENKDKALKKSRTSKIHAKPNQNPIKPPILPTTTNKAQCNNVAQRCGEHEPGNQTPQAPGETLLGALSI